MTIDLASVNDMEIISRIEDKLARHPMVRYTLGADSICVCPNDESGFAVSLRISPDGCTVSFEGWHDVFLSEEEAFDCFLFGLSTACRLRVEIRGNKPTKWTVEGLKDGGWVEDSTVGLLLQPFWRGKRIICLQNRHINAD